MAELNNPTDADISLALTGSEAEIDWAISQIARRHGGMLYARAFARLNSHSDAQDAVQDTIVTILEKATWREWRVSGPLEHYLSSTVRNKAVNIVRKRRKANEQHLGDMPFEEQKGMPSVPPDVVWGQMVESEKASEEDANFDGFVSSLKGKQKIVAEILNDFLLKHGRRPSMQEIADEMKKLGDNDANITSVKSIMRELKLKLKFKKPKSL